jgi:hypothetical protein
MVDPRRSERSTTGSPGRARRVCVLLFVSFPTRSKMLSAQQFCHWSRTGVWFWGRALCTIVIHGDVPAVPEERVLSRRAVVYCCTIAVSDF